MDSIMPALVSVIMPAYKAEAYIKEAISSVISQTYRDWELLVIDDGSPDRSGELAASFGDPRIQVIAQENAGVSVARNRGLEQAQGDWIAFLDADDIWLPEKLELQLAAAQRADQPSIVYSDFVAFDEAGNEQRPKYLRLFPPEKQQGWVLETMLQHNFMGLLTVMLPREALKKVGVFSTSLGQGEDWDLWIRLAEFYPFVYVPKSLARYREHAGGLSKDYEPNERALTQVYQTHLLAKGNTEQKRFGMWLFYRHMAHGFARQGKATMAQDRWRKAVALRPWALQSWTSWVYLWLQRFR
ncbi:MAG: glycosyltransferase [bacterium]|nr:glycosyltransferase [bacterium]